ncbi:sulfotransferase family 2 domain-containing protein [Oceanobacter sp. 5_MG-2023]|uniref:sulfotransferase family 2 domain-containing protein n=1 Tax=Oceanobacter sp. 5_MG-2023 TaxID=3062645 RepID=UPI0026E141F4|nr:sulfotransferase family 2 domain-containing protein [Oceanobacter sp. 5_MG-2023]MDO6683484.1 sulfotransferase family 2 domain-containing protein [Oceanobacter sp. 5_MG-2023]
MSLFKYSSGSQLSLPKNDQHQFAMQHAMTLFHANAIYSFIPKNGCSTMRLSVAVANGCIDGIEQGHWIHNNNGTFMPSLAEAVRANYKFVVLRCPFRRLASVFLDKFVAKEINAWMYRDVLNRNIELDDLTFESFVLSLQKKDILNSDIHWCQQSDFLLYKEYSDYFSLENFSKAMSTLKEKISLDVIDARPLTMHGIDGYELLDDKDYSQMNAFDISILKRQGKCPSPASLYTPKLIEVVKRVYAKDFTLYKKRCDARDLLF